MSPENWPAGDPALGAVTLVRGRWVMTGDTPIADGAIALQGDRILAVGPWAMLRAQYPQATVEGGDRWAVLPGLINAHHHSNGVSNLLQGIDDDFLELWLFANIAQRPQDPTLQTLLSIAQLLRSGVTSVVDVTTLGGAVEASRDRLQQQLRAYEQAGMRVALTPGATADSFLVHGEDAAFLASLPAELAQQVRRQVSLAPALSLPDYLDLMGDLITAYRSHPHIDLWFGPPGPQWVGDEGLVAIAAAAETLDTHIQTHAVESFHEKLLGPRLYGTSVVAHLRDLGVLSPRFSIAHGVWVEATDLEILASTGAAVSHNPSSNLRLRAGIAPLNALLSAGITVGLGMDGTTLGDDEDMFAELRLAARLHRTPQMEAPAPSYEAIWGLATTGGAQLMGRSQDLGRLAPGYRADLVMVDCDRLSWPWLAPEANPLHVLLLRAKALDVDTVWVNGRKVLQGGQPTGFDLAAVGAELGAQLAAAPDRAEYRALATALKPHLRQWYLNWPTPPLSPYAPFNSRQ